MGNLQTGFEWLDRLMPQGIPIPSSTVISGPGGSGKPLVGLAIVASWLRQGGQAVLIPLQYPDRAFTEEDLKQLYNLSLDEYGGAFCFVKFDLEIAPEPGAVELSGEHEIRANLVSPKAWARALDLADKTLESGGPGTLVFASALNLLLFSPTYGEAMREHLVTLLREDKSRTYLFTVSSSALAEKIATLEEAADHLLFTQMTRPERRLQVQVTRLRGATHREESIVAPFGRRSLEAIKQRADTARVTHIPAIRRI